MPLSFPSKPHPSGCTTCASVLNLVHKSVPLLGSYTLHRVTLPEELKIEGFHFMLCYDEFSIVNSSLRNLESLCSYGLCSFKDFFNVWNRDYEMLCALLLRIGNTTSSCSLRLHQCLSLAIDQAMTLLLLHDVDIHLWVIVRASLSNSHTTSRKK